MGWPKRPSGILASMGALLMGSPHTLTPMGVRITVGATALTWILCGPNSMAITLVSMFSPPFDAQ